jgi:hypothetical protein
MERKYYGHVTRSHRSPIGEARKTNLKSIPKTLGQLLALEANEVRHERRVRYRKFSVPTYCAGA